MKNPIAILFLSVLFSQPLLSAEVWGGKWDNYWTVFFIIDESKDPISVIYKWRELLGDPLKTNDLTAKREGPVLNVGSDITLRLNGKQGQAYGAFPNPRHANLVKLADDVDIKNLDDTTLTHAGWKNIPIVKEAFKKEVFAGTKPD